jgi:hypothetical protein
LSKYAEKYDSLDVFLSHIVLTCGQILQDTKA